MKRTKKEENSIIIQFILYGILLLGILVYIFSNLLPRYINLVDIKSQTLELYNQNNEINKNGIGYGEFKTLSKSKDNSSYLKEILNSIDQEFYNTHLKNNTEKTYNDFLNEIESTLNSPSSIVEKKENYNKLAKLLPNYSDSLANYDDLSLTDFKFINYIENLLEAFDLKHNNSIGINNIVPAGNGDKNQDLLENLYYIPLNLSLEGKKENIVKFLYFIDRVGTISIKTDNDKSKVVYNVDENKVLQRGTYPVINWTSSNNIYENQVVNIKSVSFKDDLEDNKSNQETLFDYILNKKIKTNVKVDIELQFFIRGLPKFKIEEKINKYIYNFDFLKSQIAKNLKTEKNPSKKNKLLSASNTLKEIEKESKSLKKLLVTSNDLNDVYNKALEKELILEQINYQIGLDIFINGFLTKYKSYKGEKIKNIDEFLKSISTYKITKAEYYKLLDTNYLIK